MKRLMLDTSIAGDFIFRRSDIYQRVREFANQGIKVGIALPAIGELFAGVEQSKSREPNLVQTQAQSSRAPALALRPQGSRRIRPPLRLLWK
jgi:hypothetical protein